MPKVFDRDASYWNLIGRETVFGQNFDDQMADQYCRVHLELLHRWSDFATARSILKTDLFAEAMCPRRAFLWDLLTINCNVTAIDLSDEICSKAGKFASTVVPGHLPKIVTCDLRKLPFTDGSFDLIVSDSTLDHYDDRADIITSLNELKRVLAPGGTLIITMDNAGNITEPFFRLWIQLGLAPFFIGKTYSMKGLKQALEKTGLCVKDSTTIMHNPRFFTKMAVAIIRHLGGDWGSRQIRNLLDFFDSLEKRRTRFLTAQFIAVKAVKPGS
jgi:SAM-dependent methyltransferase